MTDHNLQQSAGVFQIGHGSAIHINGGQFIQHNHPQVTHKCHEATDGFQHLQAHVATSAFDSQDHVDAPKCHPNTRKAILQVIMNWIMLTVSRVQWILWLNGAAGAGKSAICRSIVDLCVERNTPIARFFFFRTNPSRNNVKPLVATLVHQLLQSIPDLKPVIIPRIQSDSLIFTKSLRTQFQFLIFDPLCEFIRHRGLYPVVLLFDGVDECDDTDDQTTLIQIVAEFLASKSSPIIALFASRVEDQIGMTFRYKLLSELTYTLPLDDEYLPDADIRLFLTDSFDEIKRAHPFSRLLDRDWPTSFDLEEIVGQSSGQFIYASVVFKFCAMPSRHPKQQLEIILGLRPRGALIPFAQLDALYQQIFSQVQDIELVSLILAWVLIGAPETLSEMAALRGLEIGDIYSALAPLQSIIEYTSADHIYFLHQSLPDFLLDKDRSQRYYLNLSAWRAPLSIMAHKITMEKGFQTGIDLMMYLGRDTETTPELRDHILAFNPANIKDYRPSTALYYLIGIHQLDFGDGEGGAVYQHQLSVFGDYLSNIKTERELDDLQHPNTSEILKQIQQGKYNIQGKQHQLQTQNQLEATAIVDKEYESRN